MDVSTFFTRLLQPTKESTFAKDPDDIQDFDAAWQAVKETLEQPDERQLVRGIASTDVPVRLQHIVDALAYESNRIDEDTTGACLEYFLRNDLLANLERLCENDRPHGVRGEVLKAINNLIVLLSERFLVHNAVHRPLRRLLRSCIGDAHKEKVDGTARVVGAASMDKARQSLNSAEESQLVDLMCTVCSRMRAYPPLLLIFFHDKGWLQPHPSSGAPPPLDITLRAKSSIQSLKTVKSDPSTRFSTRSSAHHFEFLLFSYMLRFVHREGELGDTARAGLQFLFDIAFLTQEEEGGENLFMPIDKEGTDPLQDARDALAEYILDGDFAEVMAAGIGAIYSLLPSKLSVPTLADLAKSDQGITASASGGMHLGATLDDPPAVEDDELDIPTSIDPAVRSQLDQILKLLGFVQDIIHRCNSPLAHVDPDSSDVSNTQMLGAAISDAILDAVQSSFLDNVLYPSILECSPNDGSAVAVLTYLDVMVSHVDEGPLLERIIDFLLDSDDSAPAHKPSNGYYADEGRFTLKDLIIDNVNSSSWAASSSAMRLLGSMLALHCSRTISGLLRSIPDPTATAIAKHIHPEQLDGVSDTILPTPVTSNDVHLQEVELYGSLISRIDPLQTSMELTAGYAGYLTDMQANIQADFCFLTSQTPMHFFDDDTPEVLVKFGEPSSSTSQHRLNPSDELIRAVMRSFGQFLCSTPDENVALTGVLTSVALCPQRSLAGWLLYEPPALRDAWSRRRRDSDASTSGQSIQPDQDDEDPFTARKTVELPAVYQILRDLVRQVNRFRLDVDDFDRLLAERRQGLLFADHLDEAMNVMLEVEPSAYGFPTAPSNLASPRPKRRGVVGSLKSFLTPKRKPSPATPGSGTPRGTTPSLRDAAGAVTTSPFKSHYEQTALFSLEASLGEGVASGPWSPAALPPQSRPRSALSGRESLPLSLEEVERAREKENGPRKVTLSQVLDNCVVLEEFLKEIVAVITARRALGIDQVGFV